MANLSDIVVLDSNAMTYLNEAVDPAYDPDMDSSGLRDDRVALLRLYLHLDQVPWVVPAIDQEYQRIREQQRLRSHTLLAYAYLNEATDSLDTPEVEARVKELLDRHKGEQDCRVVAQAEAFRANVLLTCDNDLLQRLSPAAQVTLERPVAYWEQLAAVCKGRRPPREPTLESADKRRWWDW